MNSNNLLKSHVVIGASAVGIATAELLAERGEQVILVTRSGSGPDHPYIKRVAADATNADELTQIAQGSSAIYNCASPPYNSWPKDWPPLGAALLIVAERTCAVLATYSNLYGYGPVKGLMSENTPLIATHPKLRVRADIWSDTLALHKAGRIRATEIRSSDHFQPNSMFSLALCKPLMEGKSVMSPIPLDVPRSWTSVNDAAKLLVTVAEDSRAWGRPWHVPTNAPISARELILRFAEVNGLKRPKLSVIPYPILWAAGVFVAMLRELRTTRYQFDSPFLIDSSAATATFGLKPEPIDEALRDTAHLLKNRILNKP
ncbi:Nucleoside-diphosphate-sugar epimerase [Chitinophaga sp. YR573]|uniref:NAD-dependent epimerase n=1 Tax=Chitinophaga sp. YR573 TaxID=1881040 RepID=UPI0008BBAC7A|nr:NAD-dependent epimerase [Chitinophaga sp. YR573]SEW39338.1 Nucleoside-diphosphate-sugar epimerase [Chitinophaga sp. YR573]